MRSHFLAWLFVSLTLATTATAATPCGEMSPDAAKLSHEARARRLGELAGTCQDQLQMVQAERYYRKSIAEWAKVNGRDSRLSSALTQNNLAGLLWETGRLREAEQVMIEAARTQVEILGAGDPTVTLLFVNIGLLYIRQERIDEAEGAFQQALPAGAARGLNAAVAASYLGAIDQKRG